ncbi:UDP-3-O-(3-hydroxymyristoyl) glucosamine nacyltransferase [Chryseobacterium phage MA9V-1]|nr:UDP-3-O-(3-hydroxymyristoyl) glucosamine nacyltransferase [Chryseobacterium phage MA9V-1]
MAKTFELIKDGSIKHNGCTLYKIKALADITNHGVKAGDIGGWVESENNLQSNEAWIGDAAMVYGDAVVSEKALVTEFAQVSGFAEIKGYAKVQGNAKILGNARVMGNCTIECYATVCGNAFVADFAIIRGRAQVSGEVQVKDNAKIWDHVNASGSAIIKGYAQVYGQAKVYGGTIAGNTIVYDYAKIGSRAYLNSGIFCGRAIITDHSDFALICNIGSRKGTTIAYKNDNIAQNTSQIEIICGCFKGDLQQFYNRVTEHYGGRNAGIAYRRYYKEYMAAIQLIEAKFTVKVKRKSRLLSWLSKS